MKQAILILLISAACMSGFAQTDSTDVTKTVAVKKTGRRSTKRKAR